MPRVAAHPRWALPPTVNLTKAAGRDPRPSQPLLIREWAWWLPLLIVVAAFRLWVASWTSGITMDSPLYVMASESLAHGKLELLGPAHHGYPALIALMRTVLPGREL